MKMWEALKQPDDLKPQPRIDKVLSIIIPALNRAVWCPNIRSSDAGEYACSRVTCNGSYTIRSMIIHLNDTCFWTREKIADWLDTLDLDLSFPTPPAQED